MVRKYSGDKYQLPGGTQRTRGRALLRIGLTLLLGLGAVGLIWFAAQSSGLLAAPGPPAEPLPPVNTGLLGPVEGKGQAVPKQLPPEHNDNAIKDIIEEDPTDTEAGPTLPPQKEWEWDYQTKTDAHAMSGMMRWRDELIPQPPPGECEKQDWDARLLERVETWGLAELGTPRIFCAVYTYHKNHGAIKSIKKTWGPRCDGFVAFSDKDDSSLPTFHLRHVGDEHYNNIWQKVRAIWKYVHHWYAEEYDWFMIGGDDMFVIVENLRKLLLSEEITKASDEGKEPMFLGRRFQLPPGTIMLPGGGMTTKVGAVGPKAPAIFNSGGAGYVLNRRALDLLATHLDTPECLPDTRSFKEDVHVAYCLGLQGVHPYDTKDPLGRERFHPFKPMHMLLYKIPKNPDWYARYSIDLKEGWDCCSLDSISFHYVKPESLMLRIFWLMYGCPKLKAWTGTHDVKW